MVRVGEYEMQLVRPDGRPFPEVEHNGRTYAVASAGSDFSVKFSVLPHAAFLPGFCHSVKLRVDGVSVGYAKSFPHPGTDSFMGFLESGDTTRCVYRSFQLAQPRESEDKEVPPTLEFDEGRVRAKVYLSYRTGLPLPTQLRPAAAVAPNNSVARMPEGKKFFMAPSLTATAGAPVAGAGFANDAIQFMGDSIATLELRYETPSTLLLRGVLRQGVPEHDAILQQFPETAALKEEAQADGAAGPSRAAAAAARGRAPGAAASAVGPTGAAAGGHAGSKRRHAQQQQQAGPADVIDLTRVERPEDEVLAAKRQHKMLECDLTEDADDPRWTAVEQGAHAVE